MTYTTIEQDIAKKFAEILGERLSDVDFKEMFQRNLVETERNVCHSHDFCDANVYMAEAFTSVMGRPVDIQSETDTLLWNEAWANADRAVGKMKPCRFTDAGGENIWDGFREEGTWNGFDNVSVTVETWNKMLAKWSEENPAEPEWIDEIREERTEDHRGMVYLGHGLCMQVTEQGNDGHLLDEWYINGDLGSHVDKICICSRNAPETTTFGLIATVSKVGLSEEQQNSVAAQIAAAPSMLKALRMALPLIFDLSEDSEQALEAHKAIQQALKEVDAR